jgi:glutamate 5-kinase
MFKLCVIKLGTAVVTTAEGQLDTELIHGICKQIGELHKSKWKVALVSSGAVASGRSVIGEASIAGVQSSTVLSKRELAALGQAKLLDTYSKYLFDATAGAGQPLHAAQVLVTKDSFERRERYVGLRECLLNIVEHNIVPIINNNDVLHEVGYDFPDNDQLAAYIAGMLDADFLLLLTDIAGVFTKNPKVHNDALKVGALVDGQDWSFLNIDSHGTSSGGMSGKLRAFKLMGRLGIPAAILPGKKTGVVTKALLLHERGFGTFLEIPKKVNVKGLRRWLATGASPIGTIIVSNQGDSGKGADAAIVSRINRSSLLIKGVENVFGQFPTDSVIALRNRKYEFLGIGKSKLAASDIRDLLINKDEMSEGEEVVHADYLFASGDDTAGSTEQAAVLAVAKSMMNARVFLHVRDDGHLEVRRKKLIHSDSGASKEFNVIAVLSPVVARELQSLARLASKILKVQSNEWLLFAAASHLDLIQSVEVRAT